MGTYYSVVGGGGTGGRARVRAGGREEAGRTLPAGAAGLGAARLGLLGLGSVRLGSARPGPEAAHRGLFAGAPVRCVRSSRGGWVSARARGAVCARAWRVRARAVVFFFARRGCVGASVHALCAGCARCVCARCACVMRSPRVRERCARVGDARIACARVSRCVRACGLCKRCVCAVLLARCLWSLRAACRLCVHGCSECAPRSLRVCVCVCVMKRCVLQGHGSAGERLLGGLGAVEVVGSAMEVPAVHLQHSTAAGFYPRQCEVCGGSC